MELRARPTIRDRRATAVLGVALLVGVAMAAALIGTRLLPRSSAEGTALVTAPANSLQPVPTFGHVFVIVLENRSASSVLGSADAPYLNSLAARFGVADAYQAVAHPSQPNYLALFSGSTQGVTDDGVHDVRAPSIADQLEATGRTWRVYAENVPAGCYRGARSDGGADGPGSYARKHEPAISFASISDSATRCANIQPLRAFDPAAAPFTFIVPNMCHDAHDCPMSVADAWLRTFVPRILDSPAWRDDGVLFITFDEADGAERAANRVATIVIAPAVPAGTRSSVPHTHYSLLRTIQTGLGLDCLAASCQANTLGEFFRR